MATAAEVLDDLAKDLGIDQIPFKSCLAADGNILVQHDLDLAVEYGVQQTPTTFIGAYRKVGVIDPEELMDRIREMLQ